MGRSRSESERVRDRIGWRHGGVIAFSNFDGALFVFVYTSFLTPSFGSKGSRSGDLLNFTAFLVVSFLIVGAMCWRAYEAVTTWLAEDRQATPEEREKVLRFPFRAAVLPLWAWGAAIAVFAPMNLLVYDNPARDALRVSIAIAMGGIVSAAISFLVGERVLRPLIALALAGEAPERPATLGVRPRLLLTWALGSGVPLLGVAVLPIAAKTGEHEDLTPAIVALGLAGLAVGLLATWMAARSVADPLDAVRDALTKVREGDLSVRVEVNDGGEVGLLEDGVNRMVAGLRERQRLADLFGKHVGVEVANRALAEGAGLDSEQRNASVLFVDVIGSTAMAEVLPPDEVVQTLNAFFGAVVAAVSAEGGWVNKFEGDGALCVFGAPATQPDHAARALRAARDLRERIRILEAAHPGLDAAIGVSSGPLVAGNVGTEQRYEYTVIGRPVNESARLSELAKLRDARVLASAGATERAGDEARRWTSLGTVALRGQHQPTAIFEPSRVSEPVTQGS